MMAKANKNSCPHFLRWQLMLLLILAVFLCLGAWELTHNSLVFIVTAFVTLAVPVVYSTSDQKYVRLGKFRAGSK